jgi:glycosyltransferase involved in cell wall biosynthesis
VKSSSRPRVYYDLSHLAVERRPAFGRYAREILSAVRADGRVEVVCGLAERNLKRRRARAERAARRELGDAFHGRFENRFETSDEYFPPLLLRALSGAPPERRGEKAVERRMRVLGEHVFHYLFGFTVVPLVPDPPSAGRRLLSVHDVFPVTHRAFFGPEAARRCEGAMKWIRKETDFSFLCHSEFVRRELVRLGFRRERCHVAPLGVSSCFQPGRPARSAARLAAYGVSPGSYVLSVATLEPRKNLRTVLRAYALSRRGLLRKRPLVLAGRKGWGGVADELYGFARRHGIDVRFTGWVDDATLRDLYAGAAAFVYVPHCEGFGLPPLEAMACGTPAVTSDGSAFPETVGDAALRVNPKDERALRKALDRVAEDEALAARLRSKGLRRAARFTWRRTAERIVRVYRALARV